MSKVHYLPFSRFFPAYHPKVGEPTFFIEKIWESIGDCSFDQYPAAVLGDFDPKHHTIRKGNRFKPGDFIMPFAWSDKPYRSRWIHFSPMIEVKKVWDVFCDGMLWWVNHQPAPTCVLEIVAKNDGLSYSELMDWFKYPSSKSFSGQIICWNENINY